MDTQRQNLEDQLLELAKSGSSKIIMNLTPGHFEEGQSNLPGFFRSSRGGNNVINLWESDIDNWQSHIDMAKEFLKEEEERQKWEESNPVWIEALIAKIRNIKKL